MNDPVGSLVCFLDERDSPASLVVGGYYLPKRSMADIDDHMIAVERSFGLREQDTIKWNLKDRDCQQSRRLIEKELVNNLRRSAFSIVERIPVRVIMALVWKGKAENREESWRWGFIDILQRLSLSLERKIEAGEAPDVYPRLDVVFDWFPGKRRLDFYFDVYQDAYLNGFTFKTVKLTPLKQSSACPCLLVTSGRYSHALQLADLFVGASSDFFNWCYTGEREQSVRLFFASFYRSFRKGDDGKVVGYGLLAEKGARKTIKAKLKELGLEK